MKIAVFSDIQANLPAMEAVVDDIRAWRPDLVVMNGDLVNRGPTSDRCLALFQELRQKEGWLPIRGNHEDYVLHCGREAPSNALDRDMRRFADWTTRQLGERAAPMADWPDHLCLHGPADDWLHCTHGSMAGNRVGISESIADEDLPERVPEDVDLFVVAHTHRPLERTFRGTRILNVGSAGSPFDGDVRGSYARIEHRGGGWRAQIVRFDYDRERAQRDFDESGFLEQGGALAPFIYEEWRRARMLMPEFRRRYTKALVRGEIDLDSAVAAFLAELD